MTDRKNLTGPQQKALAMAEASANKRLYRWPGGYWAGAPWTGQAGATPDEWVGTETVRALITRKNVEVIDVMRRGDPCVVALAIQQEAAE